MNNKIIGLIYFHQWIFFTFYKLLNVKNEGQKGIKTTSYKYILTLTLDVIY